MTNATSPINRIVLATDLGAESPGVFAQALGMALQARSELYLLHVAEPDRAEDNWRRLPTVRALLQQWGRVGPDATEQDFHALGIKVHAVEQPRAGDDLRSMVAELVAGLQPDLVVLAPRVRTTLGRLTEPSIAEPVARDVHRMSMFIPNGCRPLVDPDTGRVRVRRVVVPVGPGMEHGPLLVELERLLVSFGADSVRFTVVHVGSWGSIPPMPYPQRPDWAWKVDLRAGRLVEQILTASESHNADLVAMSAFGHDTLWTAMFGSTTERVVRSSRCPVLAVPVPEDDEVRDPTPDPQFRIRAPSAEQSASCRTVAAHPLH